MRPSSRIILFALCPVVLAAKDKVTDPDKKARKDAEKLPPCGACNNLVNSFLLGMDRTKRGKFEGGDSAWEEKTQPKYATSEVRLVEIVEELCKEVERGEAQCHANHNTWEEHLETWWGLDPDTRPTLQQWLCVDTIKQCCPANHFGPNCAPCSLLGGNGQICSSNGKCKGNGTRKGNGKCSCDTGYGGEVCNICSNGFYESFKDETKILCSSCHKSCNGPCSGPGPKSCTKCKNGYSMHTEHGCMDIDECVVSIPCTNDKFCVNTEGTFRCVACDKGCNGCSSDGPDNCKECKEGWSKNKDGVCINDNVKGRIFNINNTRFFTYVGLGISTCIIFHKNWMIASGLGALVAVYISLTEYYIANNSMSGDLEPTNPLGLNL